MPTFVNDLVFATSTNGSTAAVIVAQILASISLFVLIWAIHVKIEDASVVDYVWGGSFVVTLATGMLVSGTASFLSIVILALVSLWAARLTYHLVRRHRNHGTEDGRYTAMRIRTGPSFWWKSLATVFLLQAIVQLMVAIPLILSTISHAPQANLGVTIAATILALTGFVIETVADLQLSAFLRNPANKGKLMTSGLFARSRHPNYFGEILFWWAIGVLAYQSSGNLICFVGPAILTALVVRVSGVAMLEQRHAATKPGYADWARRTNALIPWPRNIKVQA